MTAKRYKIKLQDDLFGVVDNYSADKVCVINGIRTEIEARWLCKDMNTLNDENEQLRKENDMFSCELSVSANKEISRNCRIAELEEENEQLKKENEFLKKRCNEYWEEAGLNNDYLNED